MRRSLKKTYEETGAVLAKSTIKLLVATLLFAFGLAIAPWKALAADAVLFSDDFTSAALNSQWQVLPGQGSYTVGGGRLRYFNGGPTASTTGWYNPALTLALPFTGTNWQIEIKATYSLQWCPPGQSYTGPPVPTTSCTSGAQGPEVLVKFNPSVSGNNYAGADYTVIQWVIDAW